MKNRKRIGDATYNGETAKNLKMNDATYKLRRKVIEIVYEAKKLVPFLPRIEVRITENARQWIGLATMGDRIMWIPKGTIKMHPERFREVVLHELLHAAFAVPHFDECPLMAPALEYHGKTPGEINLIFVEYCNKYARKGAPCHA